MEDRTRAREGDSGSAARARRAQGPRRPGLSPLAIGASVAACLCHGRPGAGLRPGVRAGPCVLGLPPPASLGAAPPPALAGDAVGRREAVGAAAGAAASAAALPQPPPWAEEFRAWPAGLFNDAKPPEIRWLPLPADGAADPFGDSLRYPAWLAGAWQVQYRKRDIRFPKGWGVLNQGVPGVAMASILRLPNVGAEPIAEWRFEPTPGGGGVQAGGGGAARADWASTLPSVLESFWGEARATAAPSRRAGLGWVVSYASPVAGAPKDSLTERNVTLTWLGGETWVDQADDSVLSVEWVRQRDELEGPGGVGDYKVLTALRRGAEGDAAASGFLRVAAFLQPVDDAYIEAAGEAVAVYDYSVALSRKPS